MSVDAAKVGWLDLLRPEWLPALVVVLGGVLLYSMNVLMMSTVLPSIVEDIGGAALMSWSTTFYLASSIIAASCTGLMTSAVGAGRSYCIGTAMLLLLVLPMRAGSPGVWRLPPAGLGAVAYAVLLASAFNYFAYAWAG